jgi:hypothetical protein
MATAKRKEYLRQYTEANRARIAAADKARYPHEKEARAVLNKAWRAAHAEELPAKRRDYRAANKDEISARDREYYAANKERIAARRKVYRAENAAAIAAYNRARQTAKLQRTPKWLSVDDHWLMAQAYELAAIRTKLFGFPWHVDHIFPLQGRRVSGLHVPTNLQVIPGTDNCKKSNRDGLP